MYVNHAELLMFEYNTYEPCARAGGLAIDWRLMSPQSPLESNLLARLS
jgi:hypothetical protein